MSRRTRTRGTRRTRRKISVPKPGMNLRKSIILVVISLLIGIVAGWQIQASGITKTKIKWKFQNHEVEVNLDKDFESLSTTLNKVFADSISRLSTVVWLKRNHGLYEAGDLELIPKIAELGYNNAFSSELRKVSERRDGPWAYQWDTVRVGIPSRNDQPRKSFANACINGIYKGKKIRIMSLDQKNRIEVEVTGFYDCIDGLPFPDIQLNARDAREIYGSYNFRVYNSAIALILQD